MEEGHSVILSEVPWVCGHCAASLMVLLRQTLNTRRLGEGGVDGREVNTENRQDPLGRDGKVKMPPTTSRGLAASRLAR